MDARQFIQRTQKLYTVQPDYNETAQARKKSSLKGSVRYNTFS